MFRLWERWGVTLGAVGVVLLVLAVLLGAESPESGDSDAKIQAWYASTSHQNWEIATFFVFLAGALCVIAFFGALRERLADAEDSPARISQLAFGAGLLSIALTVLAVAIFVAPAFTASDTSAADVDPSTYRMLQSIGYLTLVSGTIIGAIAVWSSSAIALRRGVFPRWFAWLGVLVGIVQLAAVFFIPIVLYWAWILVASVFLTMRRAGAPVPIEGTLR
jgi:magnesium-transporting ATPase (P-type)